MHSYIYFCDNKTVKINFFINHRNRRECDPDA